VFGGTLLVMGEPKITMVGVDTELLEELRAEEPGKADRELIENLAHRKLGMSAVRRIRGRFNLSEDEAIALGVRAVHDARRES
jgi:hypothetical protein